VARRASITTRYFNRVLTDADRTILACAGEGDISKGFKNALDCYAILWRLGYRPRNDLYDFLGVDEETLQTPVKSDSDED
jgi:hypothetical protein